MNKESKIICDKLSKFYFSNPEFYKLIRDTADHLKSYSTPEAIYSSLVMTIIAVWEEKRDKFWNQKVEK